MLQPEGTIFLMSESAGTFARFVAVGGASALIYAIVLMVLAEQFAFGPAYAAYCARTPRFGPDFSKWKDAGMLEIRPRFFLTTIRDGLMFLLAVPLFESIEKMQDLGWLATLLRLP